MNKLILTVILFLLVVFNAFSQEKKYVTHQVKKGETVFSITQQYAISKADFLKLNPDIKNDEVSIDQIVIVPNKAYNIVPNIDDGDYVLDGYLYHKVLPKEGFYSLRKEYGVSKRTLRKHNDVLKIDDLKVGQVIKIPLKEGYEIDAVEVKKEDTSIKPYLVKAKETKYMIARRYGIEVEDLESMNPQIKEGLKAETIIQVPNRKEISDAVNEDSIMYQIEKGENLFRLSQKFNVPQNQLLEHNPELKDGVKAGMVIKIPKKIAFDNSKIFIENITSNKVVKVAIMLPFTTNKSKLDFDTDKLLNITTDFYLGAEMALDSLKKQGADISVKVFDTKNKLTEVSTILKTNEFNDVDVIIGPMFLNNVKFVAQSLGNQNTAIISPVSSKNHDGFASKSTIQDAPSEDLLAKKVLDYVKDNYKGQNLIVIKDDVPEIQWKYNKVINDLKNIDSLGNLSVLSPEKGYIRPNFFKKNIQDNKENWVILLTDNPSVTNDVVQNLGVFPEKVNITMFALYHNGNFQKSTNHHLARVNLHYATSNFVNENDTKVQQFIKKYKAINYLDPTEYSFKGFDITYDALARIITYPIVNRAFSGGISERISSRFIYNKKGNKGFKNEGIYLVKYDGLNLVDVEKSSTSVLLEE